MKRLIPLILLALTACSRNPSVVLDPGGPHARVTAGLFWLFIAVNGVIWGMVLGVLGWSLFLNRVRETMAPIEPGALSERRLRLWVGIAIGATVLVLSFFVGASFVTDKQLIDFDRDPQLAIEVTGHQWWWEARYAGPLPSDSFVTANEIHVPVHTKVKLVLRSNDVIHSVWLPNLAGKRDVIPGHAADLVIEADRPGVWQGRCAEFCGLEHAYMNLVVVAEPRAQFDAWLVHQREPAVTPSAAEVVRGQQVFASGPCAMCHTIRTPDATGYSTNAPDLTHLMSRQTIGAGAAPNTTGYLAGWIIDPHGIKPGVHMPTIQQNSADYQALLAYLGTLK